MRTRGRRLAAGGALVVVVAVGFAVARGLPGSLATDVAGDALYAAAAYTGLVLLWPRARRRVPAVIATAWCVAVELLQLTGAPAALAEGFPPIALVLGTGFDPRDLVVYVLAVATAASIDAGAGALLLHRHRSAPTSPQRRADVGGGG